MPEILHITTRARWEQAVTEREYRGNTLATEGFINCETPEASPLFTSTRSKEETGVVVLRIDLEKLKPPLKWESAPGYVDRFPRVYGPINLDAVVAVVEAKNLRAVGYWRSDERGPHHFPDPKSLVQPDWHADEIDKIIAYLKAGRRFITWDGDSYCRFGCWDGVLDLDDDPEEEADWRDDLLDSDPEEEADRRDNLDDSGPEEEADRQEAVARYGDPVDMGDSDLYDGEWVWPEGLAHYVERHAVRLPEDFVESMRSCSWTVPDVPEEPEMGLEEPEMDDEESEMDDEESEMDDEEPEVVCYAVDYSFWISWATEGRISTS
jgi:uncharacterized protein (DUF952 family)